MGQAHRPRLAVLISGRGSNMLALAQACRNGRLQAQIVLVLSDRADAAGIGSAASMGLQTAIVERGPVERSAFEDALAACIERSGADLVLLAGFMRVLSGQFVQRYAGRLLNIHPSLLPKFKGLHTHERALQAHEREHGASVHFVTTELDGGPVICQARVPVEPGDTADALAARVLEQEHRLYAWAVQLIAEGRIELGAGGIRLDGQPLHVPLQLDDAKAA